MTVRALAVVGPTAVGKSDLAVAVAERLGGEVVNADSMQLYRGMDVGTAKLTVAERRGVPHHLLDVLSVRDDATVAAYQRDALAVVADIAARGRVPVLVGGSGLYVAAVVDRLEFPGTDPDVRARLEGELAEVGAVAMHERLTAVDPQAAAAILPQNARRVVRALEVVELTGAAYQAALPRPPAGSVDPLHDPDLDVSWVRVGLTAPRDELDARIAARVGRMWAGGLVDEVQSLVGEGLREGRTAARALGYAQVLSILDGRRTEAEARADTVRATQRYVRRQESWFRRDGAIRWLDAGAPDLLATALALADA